MATFKIPEAVEERNLVLDEIWEMLKGQWTIARHDFTDVALNGQNIPIDDITVPSQGFCRVIPRSVSDFHYEDEVLRSSIVHYRSRGGESEGKLIGTQGERYAFRRRYGIWSLWDIGGPYRSTYRKVTDFRLKMFKEEVIGQYKTFEVVLDASPWTDEFGRNFFQMAFLKGKTLVWELRCRFDDHPTGTMRQWTDVCTPIETSHNELGKEERSTNEADFCRENRDEGFGGEGV